MAITIKDQLSRGLTFQNTPKRIVSLVPSQTELLCDMGLEEYIIGVTKFCIHPNNIKNKSTVVGGTKQVHLEKIRALHPDIILCNKEENTKEIVEHCENICAVHVSDMFTISDCIELIKQYGLLFNKTENAEILVAKIEAELFEFEKFIKLKKLKKVAYFIWKDPWMVAGNDTFINHLLKLNKFENVYGNMSRYPELKLSGDEKSTGAELILLSTEPFPFSEKHILEIQQFYPNAKVCLVDGEMFSWYGSRLLKAFKYFRGLRLGEE